jgi:hypothetical protein
VIEPGEYEIRTGFDTNNDATKSWLLTCLGLTARRLIPDYYQSDFELHASDADRSVILIAADFERTYAGDVTRVSCQKV